MAGITPRTSRRKSRRAIRRAKATDRPSTSLATPPALLRRSMKHPSPHYRTFAKVSPPDATNAGPQGHGRGARRHRRRRRRQRHIRRATRTRQASSLCASRVRNRWPRDPADADIGAAFHNGEIGLLEGLAKITAANPARMLGLKSGRLQRGAAADLVLFNADTPWRIEEEASGANLRTRRSTAGPCKAACSKPWSMGDQIYKLAA